MSDSNVHVNLGCLPLVISLIVLWFLLFGVTVDGEHRGLSCSFDRGVELVSKPVK